ncbi:replication protein b [Stappia aggregata IAM 12614]|uniref:Replication protein b n=1 Tax=Roseibium aggregatum (strain ATCC 25650 / DSM 13394 / JCM 20685 / NBRC 16684 / NCIMB 2208 / IAM 12614 / B1) TaxID=384765 RepID=A0P073_ROSAI|nr:plasmid partitioning protein RepB [Roseibium aggregatum]EAV41481.1 replication protein b [Stappia aggregata IAM 12614] [Roseibium aggregatum IAM 12614]
MKKSIVKMMSDAAAAAAADKKEPPPVASQKVTAPVVNSMGRALSHMREDSIVALDPSKIDPSPFSDRFETDHEAEEALEELKLSIQDEGQKIPVLVRPHPTERDRYQLAYGHRRLFAIKALMAEAGKPETFKVKAYVRKLSDAELIKEQSLENGVRENLTFAEMVLWAVQLREAGLKQREMQPVLGQVQTVISNMRKIADSIPHDIIRAIGRARNVGRPAWMELAKLFEDPAAEQRVREVLDSEDFKLAAAQDRMAMAMQAARGKQKKAASSAHPAAEITSNGTVVAKLKRTSAATVFSIPRTEAEFGRWLEENLPDVYSDFLQQRKGTGRPKG